MILFKQEANSSLHSGHRSAKDPGKGKWRVIISWIAHHVYMVCYNLSHLFWYIIRLKYQIKRKENAITSRRKKNEKKKKSSICVHRESNPGQLIQSRRYNHSVIDAYGLDTWPGPKRMRMRPAYLSATPTKTKISKKKTQRRNLLS